MFAAFALCSCGSDDNNGGGGNPSGNDGIVGDWVLESYGGSSELAGKVYARFTDSGSFELYQNINEAGFSKFTGSYDYSDGTLSGAYSDGKAWKDTYSVQVANTTLKHTESNGKVAQFTATTIPDWVTTRASFAEVPAEERFF